MSSGKFSAVIFDFNGTLFWDTEHNNNAWIKFSPNVKGVQLTQEEMNKLHGRNNRDTIEYLYGGPVTEEQYQKWSDMKEQCYRQCCLDQTETFHLAPGAPELLDFLKEHNVKIGIGSMAGEGNMNFYKKHFGLLKWFDPNHICIDDGCVPGKPDPAIFLKTMKALDVEGKDCIIVEDSIFGLQAAVRAGAGFVYAIGPASKQEELSKIEGVNGVIADFYHFDRSLLNI